MIQDKIVARFRDGRILKGLAREFLPTKPTFHLTPASALPQSKPVVVHLADLKAVSRVKDLAERPQPHSDRQEFHPGKPVAGRKIWVVFRTKRSYWRLLRATIPVALGFS